MSTDNAPTVLTTDDIRALAIADKVSFHQYKGRGYISATLDGYDSRIFTAREQRTFPATDDNNRERQIETAAHMYSYGDTDGTGGWTLETAPDAVGFAMIHTPSMSKIWHTIVKLMRAGDTLCLIWAGDNNNDNHRSVGFHADRLEIEIRRGETALRFQLFVQVGPDNTARMIRRHGW